MNRNLSRLNILIDTAHKQAFERLCAREDITPSQAVRHMIRERLRQHGMLEATPPDAAPLAPPFDSR